MTLARRLAALLLLSLLALPAAVLAQAGAADTAEIKNYRLTMDKVRALSKVFETAAAKLKSSPQARELAAKEKEMEALENKDDITPADERRMEKLDGEIEALERAFDSGMDAEGVSLTDIGKAIERSPIFGPAVRAAGLKPREFAVLQHAFFQALFAHGFQQSGHLKELPKEVSAENVRFVAQHESEIKKLKGFQQPKEER